MNIVMFRSWERLPYFASFSTLQREGVGGTELQLLLHARALRDMGHRVTVAGVTGSDVTEEGVFFIGSADKKELRTKLELELQGVEIVFTNSTQNLSDLQASLPHATIVQVCQNGPHFEHDRLIDVYAMVSVGQMAHYSGRFRRYRNKFMLLANVPPVQTSFTPVPTETKKDQLIWVGSFEKQGFRRWAKAMQHVLQKHQNLRWLLCAPSYTKLAPTTGLPALIQDLHLPIERLEFANLPLPALAREISRSRFVLASLGGEDAGIVYLDAHALQVPVLTGDDIIGQFQNPPGTGLRCTTVDECLAAIEFLLANQDVCDAMGKLGRKWVLSSHTEQHQYHQLEQILGAIEQARNHKLPKNLTGQSDAKFSWRYRLERLEIKFVEKFRQNK
jgi:hypothetical protein